MNITTVLHEVFADTQLQTILLLIALDFVLGVLAALKLGTFTLSYVANFFRNDVIPKALGWAVLDVGAVIAGSAHILISGLDLTNLAHAAFVLVAAALIGSVLGSIRDLGLTGLPQALAGSGGAASARPAPGGEDA